MLWNLINHAKKPTPKRDEGEREENKTQKAKRESPSPAQFSKTDKLRHIYNVEEADILFWISI